MQKKNEKAAIEEEQTPMETLKLLLSIFAKLCVCVCVHTFNSMLLYDFFFCSLEDLSHLVVASKNFGKS